MFKLSMTTVFGELVAQTQDIDGYITYVFKMLDEDSIKEINSCYLMLVQYYNWNSDPIPIGAKGFVKFKEVRAGIDKWWDGDKHIHYKYDDCVFYKFVPLTDKISHEIIL